MLDIVKASAGSGKTHELTGQYISMLFKESPYPYTNYKSILAVTFTNKATAQMKERILKELYKLSENPQESDYYEKLLQTPLVRKKSENRRTEFIKEHSANLLISILNDYTYFNVSTIDKFFQKVMRSFARELGQYVSYNVELSHDEILKVAIDLVYNSVGQNKKLLDKLTYISLEKIEEGKDWNVAELISDLANELFKERFKILKNSAGGEWPEEKDIEEVDLINKNIIRKYRKRKKEIGEKGLAIMSKWGLKPSDYINSSRSPFNIFQKLAEGKLPGLTATFKKLVGVESWYSRTSPLKEKIIASANDGLMDLVMELIEDKDAPRYMLAVGLKQSMNVLSVLRDIEEKVQEYCREQNMVVLSETTQFLSQIIEGNDTPFIYERMGGCIDNYLLDEFQDTSVMQWRNFFPLVKEGVDNGYNSLVVGDVKQSIYRWRGSDMSLLNTKISEDFAGSNVRNRSLEYNWRSSENVINFNNLVFGYVHKLLSNDKTLSDDSLGQIYKDYFQKIDSSRTPSPGHVYVKFFDKDNTEARKMRNFECVHAEFLDRVADLLEGGYSQGDIAVLVRDNKEGLIVSKLLIEAGYEIVTDDALSVAGSQAVQRAIAYLRNINDPSDSIATFLTGRYEPFEIKERTLYNIFEEIFASMGELATRQLPYVTTFLDKVIDYTAKNGSDIDGFLKWWDIHSDKINICASDGKDAIKVMTIHKSKGLEFKAVILPFMDGDFKNIKGYKWIIPDIEPYNNLPFIPVNLKPDLANTPLAEIYNSEAEIFKIDVCNLCYVAFTRAIEQLVVIAYNKENHFGKVLYDALAENKMLEEDTFEVGSWEKPENKIEGEKKPQHDGLMEEDLPQFVSIPVGDRLKIAFKGGEFFNSPKENSSRIKGIVLHDIMSGVITLEDVKSVVAKAVEEGKIEFSEKDAVCSFITKKVESVSELHWFDSTYKVLSEVSIILPDGINYRPDRIMFGENEVIIIDYKFSDNRENKYRRQVQNYIGLLKKMGYVNVRGYLWYNDGIEEVEYLA